MYKHSDQEKFKYFQMNSFPTHLGITILTSKKQENFFLTFTSKESTNSSSKQFLSGTILLPKEEFYT